MPRIARGLTDGLIYHVINRGNDRREIFHKPQDYEAFINIVKKAKTKFPVKILAYCLMPNHFHMVLMPQLGHDLSKWMQWLMTSHVRRYHRHYGTSGHAWQGRFKSFVIQKDDHLLMVLRYVEGNPVRAGLVKSAKDWPWSSHRDRISKYFIHLIDEIPLELPVEWSRYVDESLTVKELEMLRGSVTRQSPYGSKEWQEQVSKGLGLESTIRPRGRPRKIGE